MVRSVRSGLWFAKARHLWCEKCSLKRSNSFVFVSIFSIRYRYCGFSKIIFLFYTAQHNTKWYVFTVKGVFVSSQYLIKRAVLFSKIEEFSLFWGSVLQKLSCFWKFPKKAKLNFGISNHCHIQFTIEMNNSMLSHVLFAWPLSKPRSKLLSFVYMQKIKANHSQNIIQN